MIEEGYSYVTGINRTNVYRLINGLEKRGIITRRTDDRGKFLVATDPSALEMDLLTKEEHIKQQRNQFSKLLPLLKDIQFGGTTDFTVHTYEGIEGFKQMLWHELQAKENICIIGYGIIEDLIVSRRWAEKHRQMTIEAGYQVKELTNPGHTPDQFTENKAFMKDTYVRNLIPREILPINQQTVIYNDTVATYGMQHGQRVGVEIICQTYAAMMRKIFNDYWDLAYR